MYALTEKCPICFPEKNANLFCSVAEILVRDYIAPSETAKTVAEWCRFANEAIDYGCFNPIKPLDAMEPSELAALIADVEGYEKR